MGGGSKLGLAYSHHCAPNWTQVPLHFFFSILTNDSTPGCYVQVSSIFKPVIWGKPLDQGQNNPGAMT